MLCAPLVAVLLLMRHWFVPHNYFQLAIQLLVGSVVYGVGVSWAIWTRKAWQVDGIHDLGHRCVQTAEVDAFAHG